MQQRRCFAQEREQQREARRRRRGAAGGNSSEAGRALGERKWVTRGDMESLDNNGKMQHEHRAGSASHEGPVLPSRDVNRTQLRAGL